MNPAPSDELALLRQAFRVYLSAPKGVRRSLERTIDDLTAMIAEGRRFEDRPA